MTRKEAYSIMKQANVVQHSERLVDILEALGAIKFDKEEAEMFYDSSNDCYSLPWLQNLVGEKGYKIVKSS